MTIPRPSGVPFDHVEAELAALPIASEASFLSSPVVLDTVTSRQKGLWSAAERNILASTPFIPLDEFAKIRDRVWFGHFFECSKTQTTVTLVEYLRNLARMYLDPLGRPIEPSPQSAGPEGPSPHTRRRWSWLCRALPPDLLEVARSNEDAGNVADGVAPMVKRLLEENGFAETHLHLGAAAEFPLLWANIMHALAVDEIDEKAMASPGASFDDGNKLAKWILWAAVMRLVLAEWLFSRENAGDSRGLLDFSGAGWCARMHVGLRSDLGRLTSEFAKGREGSSPLEFVRGRAIYRSLIRPLSHLNGPRQQWEALRAHSRPKNRKEVLQNDPLARIFDWPSTSEASPESAFVREALNFMEKKEETGDFAHFFWQIIRVRCLAYRHLVQRPLTPGLQWFVRSFSRIGPFRKTLTDEAALEAALRQSGSKEGLRSLEVRIGTEESVSQCRQKLREVNKAQWRDVNTEIGAVFHFSRNRGGGWRQGYPNAHGFDHSYPGIPHDNELKVVKDVGNLSGFRFSRFYLEQRRHAQALVSILQGFPCSLGTFRGVDLCTDEAGVPIWVMAPMIRWVRETGQYAAIELRRRGLSDISQLRTTVHAGEDFVHLLTGLRRLDEAVRYLGLEEGDRIGHGLALGLDPEMWARRTERIVQTQEERLFDLLWEWNCYAGLGVGVSSARLAYLQSTIARLGHNMFGRSLTPEELSQLVKCLHDERMLRRLGFPNRAAVRTLRKRKSAGAGSDNTRLLEEYLRSTEVWRNGRALETIVWERVEHELEALNRLQRELRRNIGKLGLTVEITPSSNLMVADLGFMEEHPIWSLMPIQAVDDVPPLSVCIGSDDPLTFATSLPQEYQLLFDTVVLAGQTHEVALGWLEKARAAGVRGRFTLPRSFAGCEEKWRPNVNQQGLPVAPP